MTKAGRVVSALLGGALLVASGNCGAQVMAPAVWTRYDMIIELRQLPKQYACRDLWFRFRDVLWAVGARRISEILPYDCGSKGKKQGRYPKVHVAFSLPEEASKSQLPLAPMRASPTQIHLGPGRPHRLDDSDCELLRQMNGTLFNAIPLKTITASWNCAAANSGQPRYELTLQVLEPITQEAQKKASQGG